MVPTHATVRWIRRWTASMNVMMEHNVMKEVLVMSHVVQEA